MTGPSPWRLPSPRGGLTSVTVSGSTIEPVGSIIFLPVPTTRILPVPETSIAGERHECDARRSGGPTHGVGRSRVWAAYRERLGADLVRARRGPARAPRNRGCAEGPVLKRPDYEPNERPAVTGTKRSAVPGRWMLM